ncbi:MAG: putative glucose-6-phosphate isomerase, partial [Actinomycetota bacterium]
MTSARLSSDSPLDAPAWTSLRAHAADMRETSLRALIETDTGRPERLTLEACGISLDMSRQRVSDEVLVELRSLAEQRGVSLARSAMLAGEHINNTEDRAVLHTALRRRRGDSLLVDGQEVTTDVHEVLDRMGAFAERVRSGEWKGATGQPIRAVVNIGIGGSDLGPAMAYLA